MAILILTTVVDFLSYYLIFKIAFFSVLEKKIIDIVTDCIKSVEDIGK